MGNHKSVLKEPEYIMKKGKATKVILDIDQYQELLERIEDTEDLVELTLIRKGKPSFRPIENFLKEKK